MGWKVQGMGFRVRGSGFGVVVAASPRVYMGRCPKIVFKLQVTSHQSPVTSHSAPLIPSYSSLLSNFRVVAAASPQVYMGRCPKVCGMSGFPFLGSPIDRPNANDKDSSLLSK